jgi:hypothetical protein
VVTVAVAGTIVTIEASKIIWRTWRAQTTVQFAHLVSTLVQNVHEK